MSGISGVISSHAVSHTWKMLAAASFFIGISITGLAAAETPDISGDLQITKTLDELLGAEDADRYRDIISPKKSITWDVYIPKNASTEPPGVMVYISPVRTGQIDYRWREVMDRQNLVYISANSSGNRKTVKLRVVLAVMGLKALGQQIPLAADRVYVSGFSGGGRVASYVASQFPELFTGAIYICGADFWKQEYSPKVELMLPNRFVFVTGSKDFNRDETRAVYRRYLDAGAVNSKLMVIPGMAHEKPGKQDLIEALDYLGASSPSVSG
jgi:predicted esterase